MPDLINIDQKIYDACNLGEALGRAYIKCKRCQKPLDVGNHGNREWVAKYPSRTNARGYQILPFSTERLDIPYVVNSLIKYRNRNNLKGFYNTVLGRAYTDDDIQLGRGLLLQAFTANPNWVDQPVSGYFSVGIDVGKTCHIVVAEPNGDHPDYVHFETCPIQSLMSRLDRLDKFFNFKCGGIDWTPEWKLACEVRDWSQGRIMPVQYSDGKPVQEVKDMTGVVTHISCNRTDLLDTVANGIRCGESSFSGYINDQQKEVIINHFRDMVRDVDSESDSKPRWKKISGVDHFFHAAAYSTSGMLYTDVLGIIATPPRVGALVPMQQPLIVSPTAQQVSLFGGVTRTTKSFNNLPTLLGGLK